MYQLSAVDHTMIENNMHIMCALVNSQRACAGTCLVCLFVCVSVTTLVATLFVLTLEVRYVGVYYIAFLGF